jgi:hypothetical protein
MYLNRYVSVNSATFSLKMLNNEELYRFTVPGASPFFTEEPLRDANSICRVLRNFGREEPNKWAVESAIEFFSDDDCHIVFTLTFMQKFMAALKFDWDGYAVTRLSKYYPDVDLTELEPLFWEDFTDDKLFFYHRKDKSFWAYCCCLGIDPEFQLVKLGNKWTDIAANCPAGHLSQAQMENAKRRRGKENITSNKPG